MKLSLGIVGLPNVGKSTLFNSLTKNGIPAENFPFCTIDPNVGVVPVADPRLHKISDIVQPQDVTPAVIEFWDIAGLVKGAAAGEGLGNKFLANIRNTSAIVHVVRAFESGKITHVEDSVNPERDIDLIHTELILKDMETVETKMGNFQGQVRANPKLRPVLKMLESLHDHLSDGQLANQFDYDKTDNDKHEMFISLFLLTAKPFLFVVNADADKIEQQVKQIQDYVPEGAKVIGMNIKLESEIAELDPEEQELFLEEIGMEEPALHRLSRAAYDLLGLMSYFTAGEKEVRAWTINKGDTAPKAAGAIHTDFEDKFIKAEIVAYPDFIANNGWNGAREQGLITLAGRDYVMQDGDVALFKHG